MDGPAQHQTTDADAVGPGAILGEYTLGARLERRSHADVYEATVTASGPPLVTCTRISCALGRLTRSMVIRAGGAGTPM